jgi:hypothetical protein
LLEAPLFNEFVQDTLKLKGARVKVKAENLQHTGAFKFRGATNKLLQLSDFQKSQGVVAFSSGNFAQALALASRNVGVKCTIVSPHDAPPLKLERTVPSATTIFLNSRKEGCGRIRKERRKGVEGCGRKGLEGKGKEGKGMKEGGKDVEGWKARPNTLILKYDCFCSPRGDMEQM